MSLLVLAVGCSQGAGDTLMAPISPEISQARQPGEPYRDAARRHLGKRRKLRAEAEVFRFDKPEDFAKSIYDSSAALEAIDPEHAPSISGGALDSAFRFVRDPRFIQSPAQPDFLRRESWLYPDDGCFSRAELAAQRAAQLGLPRPAKLFVFGDLQIRTPNAPSGQVSWWFHVVPAFRVDGQSGSGALRVVDPAVDPTRPLSAAEWAAAQSSDPSGLSFSLCQNGAYGPDDSCDDPDPGAASAALEDEYSFLSLEWSRQLELGRDPEAVLGDRPPWQ